MGLNLKMENILKSHITMLVSITIIFFLLQNKMRMRQNNPIIPLSISIKYKKNMPYIPKISFEVINCINIIKAGIVNIICNNNIL